MGTEPVYIDFLILEAITEVLLDEDASQEIKDIRYEGLRRLWGILRKYCEATTITAKLVVLVCEEKIAFIKDADTKGEIDEILGPSLPEYDCYNETWSGKTQYHSEAEELLFWSVVNPFVEMVHYAEERFLALSEKYFPDVMRGIQESMA